MDVPHEDDDFGPSNFFEEQAATEVREKIEELVAKYGLDLEGAASKAHFGPGQLDKWLGSGEITINELALLLYHLGYRMLWTMRPLSSADHQQAENWSKS